MDVCFLGLFVCGGGVTLFMIPIIESRPGPTIRPPSFSSGPLSSHNYSNDLFALGFVIIDLSGSARPQWCERKLISRHKG